MRTCALIPAFNEAPYIADVVERAREHVTEVVVIDDGSGDGTAEIAEAAGATCLQLPGNCGKASALRTGMAYARDHDFTYIITLDGDGQHLPEDIPVMLRVAEETGADLIIGARDFDRALMPRSRYFSNVIGSRLASALVGCKIRDSQSGFRLFRLDKIDGAKLRSRYYEFEMEILIKMARAGCTIAHAPIRSVYDEGHARSKMKPVRDTVRVCLWSLAFRFLGA
ncbi:MAG TPA: glycosyltransferase family 2 protein [Candidatus Aquilonibacter sp.]|jgi:glycosyltransferase involved in cell wall biosynthesis|nr:glycosyltransferase family 2 protein [Candidatus Aquilonibacter sp.]